MQNMKENNRLGMTALHGSAVFLLLKLISLFYVVPLRAMAGAQAGAEFAAVKDILSVCIEIGCAGIPYAVIAMLIKRQQNQDYRTTLLIRRLSITLTAVFSFVTASAILLFSGVLAGSILTSQAPIEDLGRLQNLLAVSAVCIFLSPVVDSFGGYLIGLGNHRRVLYIKVTEWAAAYAFMFIIGAVYLNQQHASAVSMSLIAVFGLAVGTVTALLLAFRMDHQKYSEIVSFAVEQQKPAEDMKTIRHELLSFSFVLILSALFGNSRQIIHTFFFLPLMEKTGMDYLTAKTLYGILELNCALFIDAVQLAAVLIFLKFADRMTDSFVKKQIDQFCRSVADWLNTTLYYLLPVCFTISVLAKEIYEMLFGAENIEIGSVLLSWTGVLAMISSLAAVCWVLLMQIHHEPDAVTYLIVGSIVKGITIFPLINWLGAAGAVVSSILCSAVIVFLTFAKLSNLSEMSYSEFLINGIRILAASMAMNGAYVLLKTFVFPLAGDNRLMALGELVLMLACGALVYIFVMNLMGVRKKILRTCGRTDQKRRNER